MKEAQTQEEVSTFSVRNVVTSWQCSCMAMAMLLRHGNIVASWQCSSRFPSVKAGCLWVNADCSPVEPVLNQVIALISRRQRRTEFTLKL